MTPFDILVVGGILAAMVCLCLTCCLSYVPVDRFRLARHVWTRKVRRLNEGWHWISPMEENVQLSLPSNDGVAFYYEWRDNSYMRYDPPPYKALTKDQFAAKIDLSVHYNIDFEKAAAAPTSWKEELDDHLRARTLAIVSEIDCAHLNTVTLAAKFAAVQWPWFAGAQLRISQVIVQKVSFDEQTRTLLAIKNTGVSDTVALSMLHGNRGPYYPGLVAAMPQPVVPKPAVPWSGGRATGKGKGRKSE